jgi:hypothetical protein
MGHTASRTQYATKGISGDAGTENGEKLVGGGSYRDHRGRHCCSHAAVKSGGWDGRGGHTEERGGRRASVCSLPSVSSLCMRLASTLF